MAKCQGERANYQKFWLTPIRDVFNVDKPEDFIQFEVPVKQITQSDGSKLMPYEQARRYVIGLPVSMHPKKIITCNFRKFLIYDMETLEPPIKILLEELSKKYHLLELSLQAGEIVAKIYDAISYSTRLVVANSLVH